MSRTLSPAGSTATTSMLASALACGAVLPLLARSAAEGVTADRWLGAWAVVALLGAAATQRHRLPDLAGGLGGLAWLGAGMFGAAVLGRHALDALAVAAAELPLSSRGFTPLDLGETLLLVALLVVCLPGWLYGALRKDHPGLGWFATLTIVPVVVLLGAKMAAGTPGAFALSLSPPDPASVRLPAALAWTLALAGPGTLHLSSRQTLSRHVLPPLLALGVLVTLPVLTAVLSVGRLPGLASSGLLAGLGSRVLGPWGDRIGGGIEVAVMLAAIVVLLTLSGRAGRRRLPSVPWITLPTLVVGTVILVWAVPVAKLIDIAAWLGWVAVLLGIAPREGDSK